MVISHELWEEMVAHARESFPNEACGLVAAQNGQAVKVYRLTSAEPSPVFYRIDPKEQLQAMMEMDDRDWELGIIFHSHTRTRAYPSATDIDLAHYPDALYAIVSLAQDPPDVRAYTIVDGKVEEATLEVLD